MGNTILHEAIKVVFPPSAYVIVCSVICIINCFRILLALYFAFDVIISFKSVFCAYLLVVSFVPLNFDASQHVRNAYLSFPKNHFQHKQNLNLFCSYKALASSLISVEIRSMLYIETADRPGLLLEIIKIIADTNIDVESAEIDTEVRYISLHCFFS